jgi:tetratricopeptide (TPR) repeat protein
MKHDGFIGLFLLLALLAACTSVPEPVETPSPELLAIDSLMWQQPDSALLALMAYEGDASEYNHHYAQLLTSELLYKNDYEQTNRRELQQAVAYFDSLLCQFPPLQRGLGGFKTRPDQTNQIAFLAARAHYINGVGYYENDSAVPACREYLKALEIMEGRFEEKELVGKKARFMTYSFNRLIELFSAQFMMESAIVCGERALLFCRIEPTSLFGVSNLLYYIGKQYDMLGNKDKAKYYINQAIAEIPSKNSLVYRDIKSTKALCDYEAGEGFEQSMAVLMQMLADAVDDDERLTRFLSIGSVFYEEGLYDSALHYLEPVFEKKEDMTSRIQASECLRNIFDYKGDSAKSEKCIRFLAQQKKSEGQNKTLVSQLEDLFQGYLNWKQEQRTAQEKRKAVLRTIWIIGSIAVVVATLIVILLKRRNSKRLREVQHSHQMQQAALSGRLKRSNEELHAVSKQLKQSIAKNVTSDTMPPDDYAAFVNAPICRGIVQTVNAQHFKSKMDYLIYKNDSLSKEQLLDLRNAAEKHLARFVSHIHTQFPSLTNNDMDYCYLFLLGLSEADISALMQRAYTTVCDRSRKIKRTIGTTGNLYHVLRNMLSV